MAQQRKRSYDRTGRTAASAATRDRIIDAARSCFVEIGYSKTTMRAIADEAGVHVDTVYALAGRKPELARELIERALSGADRAIPAAERDYVAAIRAEPDPRRKLRIYANATVLMLERLAPLFLALRDAAAQDEAARDLWRSFSDRRAANMRQFVADVAASGPALRAAYTEDTAADMIWATNSPELYVLLTGERGWSPSRYEDWLADTWSRLLLDQRRVP